MRACLLAAVAFFPTLTFFACWNGAALAQTAPAAGAAASAAQPKAKKKGPSKAQVLKLLGRFLQTNQWDKLEPMAETAYDSEDLDLKSMGAWYKTLILANKVPPLKDAENHALALDEILASLKEAVDLGYKNPAEIETASQLIPLHSKPEFAPLVADLWAVVRAEARARFQETVDAALAGKKGSATGDLLGLGELSALSGGEFWVPGKVTALIITRVHHDGFHKLLPILNTEFRSQGEKFAGAVMYYQLDGKDESRKAQTVHEVDRLGVKWPVAIVDQAQKNAIEKTLRGLKGKDTDPLYFPTTVFLNPDGTPILAQKGLLLDWQAELLFSRLSALVADSAAATSGGVEPVEEAAAAAPSSVQAVQEAAESARAAALRAREAALEARKAAAEAAAPAVEAVKEKDAVDPATGAVKEAVEDATESATETSGQ